MGLRNWVKRPIRGRQFGVEDLTAGGSGIPESRRRRWTLATIDAAPFQVWVVIVAGIGFLTDAFGLFALNVVTPMLGYVYWPHHLEGGVPSVPSSVKTAMMCSTLVGTMLGQIGFGFAADQLGRRKMYGLELVIIIVGTMLLLMSSNGEKNSMAIGGWVIPWRAIMGIGIGADYPLSAVITAEFAPRKHRARMLSWVFFAQPIGQLLANVLSFAAVEAYKPWIEKNAQTCQLNDLECFRAIDRLWRLVVGIGIVPAVIALAFRFTIPESPRYKLDILQNTKSTVEDTAHYFGAPELDSEHGEAEILHTPTNAATQRPISRCSSNSSEGALNDVIDNNSGPEHRLSNIDLHRNAATPAYLPPGDPEFVPPLASWADAKNLFITEKNWQYLLGTSLAWLFLDFAFYGLGLSSPQIVSHIWQGDVQDPSSVYQSLSDNSKHTLIMVSIGTVVGGLLMVKVVKYVSPKVIQFWGFLVLFVLFIVTGSAWTNLLDSDSSRSGLIVLYALSHIAFNLGPNVTTFIIPAEIFPTRYRCTCHGIAAASGKLGSWIVQIFLAYAFQSDKSKPEDDFDWERQNFGHILQVMSAFMVAGAVTTYFLVPETRDHDNKSRTLEVLACGKKVIDELNKQRKREDEED
ncbi:Inorganic phosphate transporter [Pyrenophora tritici-repentis]|uniref:AraJ, Arabinose efflux permease n=2 Tax=Pyrenophora tritici-repentis TaxID=45151 RepID=A0A2W1ED67_9PLEO|nr:inorganic phosphate transporter 1-4 /Pi cotransporter [Pyrenophora tritici-repentis Pt-1C-BFP]KAF7574725.1 AraJ, Arabinose efflux permease [Pyrenophora tritici-repentis]EDU45291.1 inorganic phosphate transporter 1-4 /Pi cotransporter [Pyrenophora tritici-repentis Pt-1C-BFP]KAI0586929.1 Inorganic phosphate transporter [Pyrenophora tritici-repentis]KAI0589759.1 Inorganic phosphate transporter [Pyrenophora tritici-repentis]KAI0610551.1 Inorganic phosphate transporter [Pyrenophora tritici-repen